MSKKSLNFDDILPPGQEQEEQPVKKLPKEFVNLLTVLDRLLSIGSYYQPGHERYQEVACEAFNAVTSGIGPNKTLAIEIAKDGFWIEDGFLEKDAREGRRLHELFDPLNIAEIVFHREVSAEDLHKAMTVLKHVSNTLTSVDSYKEIKINGLPDTVTTTDRSLYVRTRGRNTGPAGTRNLVDAMSDFHEIPDAMLVATPEGQALERDFLGIISGIMENGDPTKLAECSDEEEREELISQWIPDGKVKAIKAILRSLERTNSDPMMLESLIGHAQKALEMTGDPLLVEMVFHRLRKEAADRASNSKLLLENRPKPRSPKKRPIKYTMTTEELVKIFAELDEIAEYPEDMMSPSDADCLGICVQVLAVAPTEDLVVGVGQTIYRILGTKEIAPETTRVLGSALAAATTIRDEAAADLAVPMFCVPLRRYHPELLAPTWAEAWKNLGGEEQKERAWPHLVNDILMGMEWADPTEQFRLYEDLSKFDIGPCPGLLDRLEDLQALREENMAPDLFHAPAPLLFPVHRVLLNCSMGRDHGERMQERLLHQRPNRLSDTLLMALGEFKLGNKAIYHAILLQGNNRRVEPSMREVGGRLLRSAILRLSKDERQVPWLPEAIRWLGKLDSKKGKPVLEKILNEKIFFFFPVWPAECRDAAQDGLDHVSMPVDDKRHNMVGNQDHDNDQNDDATNNMTKESIDQEEPAREPVEQ